jgi:hypothetical protein
MQVKGSGGSPGALWANVGAWSLETAQPSELKSWWFWNAFTDNVFPEIMLEPGAGFNTHEIEKEGSLIAPSEPEILCRTSK